MKNEATGRRGESCLSDAKLDALTHDELSVTEVGVVNEHLASCDRCRARCAALTEARDAWRSRSLPSLSSSMAALPPSMPPARQEAKVIPFRRRAVAWAGGAAAAMAAAASLLVMVRTNDPDIHRPAADEVAPAQGTNGQSVHRSEANEFTTRAKGDLALRIFLDSPQGARELVAGDTLQAGDRLRFALSGVTDEVALVIGVDGTGNASVYAPASGRFSVIGRDGSVDGFAELDAVIGPERLVAVVCDTAPSIDLTLDAVRQRLNRGLEEGCRTVERQFDKRIAR